MTQVSTLASSIATTRGQMNQEVGHIGGTVSNTGDGGVLARDNA